MNYFGMNLLLWFRNSCRKSLRRILCRVIPSSIINYAASVGCLNPFSGCVRNYGQATIAHISFRFLSIPCMFPSYILDTIFVLVFQIEKDTFRKWFVCKLSLLALRTNRRRPGTISSITYFLFTPVLLAYIRSTICFSRHSLPLSYRSDLTSAQSYIQTLPC